MLVLAYFVAVCDVWVVDMWDECLDWCRRGDAQYVLWTASRPFILFTCPQAFARDAVGV